MSDGADNGARRAAAGDAGPSPAGGDTAPSASAAGRPAAGAGPEGLRRALAAYVAALHEAYLEVAGRAAPDRLDELPLAGAPFSVAVVAAPDLHLVATREPLPALAVHEEPLWGELGELSWQVRFLDATVLPELGAEPDPARSARERVLAALGVGATLYHLMVGSDTALGPHHAMHAGTGLANAHLGALGEDAGSPPGGGGS